jgi:hypothetical protein
MRSSYTTQKRKKESDKDDDGMQRESQKEGRENII